MLKLVPRRSASSGAPSPARKSAKDIRRLRTEIDHNVEIGGATQRAIARLRRRIIELQRVLHAASPPGQAEVVHRIAAIHQRLLFFSASVELEMDNLDVLRGEVDRLSHARPRSRR